MPNLPMITDPAFTYEEAADATIADLEKFQPYELAQLLSDAQFGYDNSLQRANEFQADYNVAAAEGSEWGKEWCIEQEKNFRVAAIVAERAAAKLHRAYGLKKGYLV